MEIIKSMKLLKYFKYLYLLPIIYGITIVLLFGVNLLFWDDWELLGLYEHIDQNGFFHISTLKKLFLQHNEHRMFFPGIIMIIVYKLTNMNVKIAMFITQMMVITVYSLCIKYYKMQKKITNIFLGNYTRDAFIFLSGIACFSSIQYENFLWGFQVAFYMAIFASVISLYWLQKYFIIGGKMNYCFSISFAIIASFSHLHGIFIWPIIVIATLIYILSEKQWSLSIKIIPFILIGFVCYLIYFSGWNLPGHRPMTTDVYLLIQFFLGNMGGMFTGSYSRIAVLLGGITVLLCVALVLILFLQRNIKESIFPIGLIGFSFAAIGAITIGRAGLGIEWANASRYMSFSVLSYIGIIMLIYKFLSYNGEKVYENKIINIIYKNKVFSFILVSISILLLIGNFIGLLSSKRQYGYFNDRVSALQHYESQPFEFLSHIYYWKNYEHAYDMINKIKKFRLNVFSNFAYNNYNEIPISTLDNLNRIELNHHVGIGLESFAWDDKYIYVRDAWAIDYINKNEYTNVYMMVNDSLYETADHLYSPDVADYFNNRHYRNIRFSFSFSINDLNIGENNFSVLVILNDGITYYESNNVNIYFDSNRNISFINDNSISERNITEEEIIDFKTIYKVEMPQDIMLISSNDIRTINNINEILVLECGSLDPHINFFIHEPITRYYDDYFVKINFSNSKSGTFQVFFDYGDGFSEENSFKTVIDTISEIKEFYLPIVYTRKGKQLVCIRVDPPDGTIFEIETIEVIGKK
jgi:hypothetical protein